MYRDLISVIVPVYNVEKFLHKCIESIISQTYDNIELILIDDGSSDHSGEICNEYAENNVKIRVIHKVNGGVSSARNAGLDIARGKYICFCDSDDYISSRFVEDMHTAITHSSADISMCALNMDYPNCSKQICAYKENKVFDLKDKEDAYSLFINPKIDMSMLCNKMYSRDLIGDTRLNTSIIYGEDQVFNLEIYQKANTICFVPKPLYNYYIHNDSCVRKNLINIVELRDRLLPYQEKFVQVTQNEKIMKYFARAYMMDFVSCLYVKSVQSSKKEAKELFNAVLNDPKKKRFIKIMSTNRGKYKLVKFLLKLRSFSLCYALSKMNYRRKQKCQN